MVIKEKNCIATGIHVKVLLSLILFCFCLTPCSAQDNTITYRKDAYGRIILDTSINSQPAQPFLFDSLSYYSAVTNSTVDSRFVKKYSKGTIRHTSSMGTLRLPIGTTQVLGVGDLKYKNEYLAIYPDIKNISGLIGVKAFYGRLIKIDPNNQKISILNNAISVTNKCWDLIAGIRGPFGGIVISTRQMDVDLDLIIASGLNHSIVSYRTVRELFPERTNGFRELTHTNEITHVTVSEGLKSSPQSYPAIMMPQLTLGKAEFGEQEMAIRQVDAQSITGFRDANVILLGSDFLNKREIILDYRNFQIWLPTNNFCTGNQEK